MSLHIEHLGKPLNGGQGFPHPYRAPEKLTPAFLTFEDCDQPGRLLLDDEIVVPTLAETELLDSHWWATLEPMSRAERWQTGETLFEIAEGLQKLASAAPDGPALSRDGLPILLASLRQLSAAELARNITDRPLDSPGIKPLLEEAAERIATRCAWRVNDIAAALNAGHLPPEPEPDDEAPEMDPPAPRFRLLSPDDLAALPPMRWRVRGVLPETGLAAIYGPPGCGKSFLVLDMLAAVAMGRPWFNRAAVPCACAYVALEGEAGIAQRVRAYMARHGTPEGLRVILTPLDIRKADDRLELCDTLRAAGMAGGVLALDTLNRAAPGADENSSVDMGELIGAMKAIQANLGGLVLVVHHAGKDVLRGLRGHSSLLAALDAVVEVGRQEQRREWSITKAKDGEDEEAHPFTLQVVELGEDAEGWPVTSCVVQAEEPAAEAVSRAKVPRGGNQKVMWDGLGELLRESHHFGQADAPPTRPCVKLEEAIAALRGLLPVTPDRQTERARLAVTGLITKGLIHHRDGWLWCA